MALKPIKRSRQHRNELKRTSRPPPWPAERQPPALQRLLQRSANALGL